MAGKAVVTPACGPWRGVRDVVEPKSAKEDYLEDLRNGIILRPQGTIATRPAFKYLVAQAGLAQGCYFSSEIVGQEHTLVAISGALYEYDWTANTLTNRTPGGITINATGRVFFCWFNNELIVSDGVNRPWSYNVVTHAGTDLTNAPVTYGRPTVHYAKLALIKAAERDTFVWSEEAQPNVGYEAGGYNNSWTLAQSSPQGALYALVGTNEALYYVRQSSSGKIIGAVTSTFVADGVHDSVSPEIGTLSPDSFIKTDTGEIIFLDQNGQPQRMNTGGGSITPIYMAARVTSATTTIAQLANAWGTYLSKLELYFLAAPLYAQSSNRNAYTFDHTSNEYGGTWAFKTSLSLSFGCGCEAKNLAGERVLFMATTAGALYAQRGPSDTLAYDSYPAAVTAMPEEVIVPEQMGVSSLAEKTWTGLSVTVKRQGASCPTITTNYRTPRAVLSAVVNKAIRAGISDQYGKVTRGIRGWGRYIQPRVTNEAEAANVRLEVQEIMVIGQQTHTPISRGI